MYSELKIFFWENDEYNAVILIAKDLDEARQIIFHAIENNVLKNPTTFFVGAPFREIPPNKEEIIELVNSEPYRISPLMPIVFSALNG